MGFANKYLSKHLFHQPFNNNSVDEDLKIVVTIPVYREPNIIDCLAYLDNTNPIDGKAEVIIIINSSEKDNNELREYNRNTFDEVSKWISEREESFLSFKVYLLENLPAKHAGVGLARKIAMDEAISCFEAINNQNGIITSFDADTVCEDNYFTSIQSFFKDIKKRGASIYFEHPINGSDYPDEVYKSSAYYELYLRYYINSLRFTGHPHAFHCIGSAFAVRAKDYIAQGGMNKKQAGEDFYFLQKIISQGEFGEINDTVLKPSSRLSDRTPFGTGRSIADMCVGDDIDYLTYAFECFIPLKSLFSRVDSFYKSEVYIDDFSDELQEYLGNISFVEGVKEINRNCASLKVFRDKFFRYMNIFKSLKYLNFVSESRYLKESVLIGVSKLFNIEGMFCDKNDVFESLSKLRDIDKNR
jgi:hypothetical protein